MLQNHLKNLRLFRFRLCNAQIHPFYTAPSQLLVAGLFNSIYQCLGFYDADFFEDCLKNKNIMLVFNIKLTLDKQEKVIGRRTIYSWGESSKFKHANISIIRGINEYLLTYAMIIRLNGG